MIFGYIKRYSRVKLSVFIGAEKTMKTRHISSKNHVA